MSHINITSMSLSDLVAVLFSQPLFSLIVAALIVAGALLLARRRVERSRAAPQADAVTQSVAARYLPERRALGIGAISVIVAFAIGNVALGYLFNFVNVVEWWRYATPVFAAALCLIVVLCLILFRGTTPPEQPVVSTARRTWTSFGSRMGLFGAGAAFVALLATTIAAGLASSADGGGRYIYLELRVPNEVIDPIRPWFYGWDFGVPVLVCLAVLAVATWATLRSNAVRPFLRPETVGGEQAARTEVASAVVRIATAGMLLALAGAWRFIARAGSISQLGIEGHKDLYEVTWRYAEFAAVAGWFAPAVEITAFALLLLVASRLRRGRILAIWAARTEGTERTTHPETVR